MAFKLRKRVLLTIALTALMLVISHDIWLIRRPIRTEFDIARAQGAKIEVQLNRKDNNEFLNSKINKASSVVKTNDLKHIIIKNKTSKRAKRFRLEFSNLEIGKTFEIKDISLHFKKCKLNELDKFVAEKADLTTKDGTLYLTPKEQTITLLYNKPINEKGPIKFEFELFTIILILSSLFGYKLMDYIADFSSVKHKSRVDIVFLCIFFSMLFIPMSHINQDEISKSENRTLAKWKPILKNDGTLNYNFGKDFEAWFNDRFNTRRVLISTLSSLKIKTALNVANINSTYYIKSNGYVLDDYNFNHPEKEDLEKISANINKFNEYCKSKHIKLYVIIPPYNTLYNKDINPIYTSNVLNNANILKNYAKKHYNLEIIEPYETLHKADIHNRFYFKTDHHLTDEGCYALYKHIISVMQKDFPLLTVTQLNDFNKTKNTLLRYEKDRIFKQGAEYRKLGINNTNIENTEYIYYDYKYSNKINLTSYHNFHIKHKNPNGKYKLLLIGDSFSENLVYFLNTSFADIEKFRTNGGTRFEPIRDYEFEIEPFYNFIDEYKPDAIILIRHSGAIKKFAQMYPDKKGE